MTDWKREKAKRDAYPETDLLVSSTHDNSCAAIACPYCDETIRLHGPHDYECHNCGASFDLRVRWSR